MRHIVDPVELIRNQNPVPDAHQLPDKSTASIEALFEEIIGMEDQVITPTTETRRRGVGPRLRVTRKAMLLAAALVVLSASVAGAAITLLQPDPEQAAAVEDDFSPLVGTVHPLGWRPDLQAEQTNCLLPGADEFVQEMLATRPAYDFPLQDALTAEHLAVACTDDDSYASENGYTAAAATVCVADVGRHVEPTVVIDGSHCAAASPDLRPITKPDLAMLNDMRAIEVALLAVPSETGCPTIDEARQWIHIQFTQLGLALEVVELDEGIGHCYRGTVQWSLDRAHIEPVGPQADMYDM